MCPVLSRIRAAKGGRPGVYPLGRPYPTFFTLPDSLRRSPARRARAGGRVSEDYRRWRAPKLSVELRCTKHKL